MRKKLGMIITMSTILFLVGCGAPTTSPNDTPTSEVTSEPTNESEEISTDVSIEDGLVEEGTLGDVPSGEKFELGDYDKEGVRTVFTEMFDDTVKAEAWMQAHRFENPNYSYYINYFKNGDGDEMSFTWVGPNGFDVSYGISKDEITFNVADDNHRLYMWYGGELADESEFMRNFSKDVIMEASNLPYDAETFQVIEDDNTYKVIFQVTITLDGKEFTGYECWIEYYDSMDWYEFEYFSTTSSFDSNEALAVVNSIERVNLDDLGLSLVE